jgi:flagellar biosynthesis/type III secretory pathway protein FliH
MAKILKREAIEKELSVEARLALDDASEGAASVGEKKVFRQSDLEERGRRQEVLDAASAEARAIKARARELYLQIEQKTAEAQKIGFEQGRQEGLQSVTEMQARLKLEHEKMLQELEKDTLGLVYEIAEKVIGDALKISDDAILGMIRETLKEAMGNELVVLVSPVDYDTVREKQPHLVSAIQGTQTLVLKSSEAVRQGGCVIESELGTIEAQLDLQLEAIKKALGL